MKNATIAFILLPLVACAARAQEPRGDQWPPAEDIVTGILAGERSVPIAHALMVCPEQNFYGDVVWSALLRAPLQPEVTSRLAASWARPLIECDDERIVNWYRHHLAGADEVLSAQPFLYPLRHHETPETQSFLRELAFDDARPESLRSEILVAMARGATADERMYVYLEGLQQPERLPQPYASSESWYLVRSPVAERFVTGAVDLIVRRRGGPSAADLLIRLVGFEPVRESAALRGEVLRAADAVLASPRSGPDLVEAAGYVRERLGQRNP